jgi:hypothetical protein
MTHSIATYLSGLQEAANGASAAEAAFRREAAERVKVLEAERAFAFRRLNFMRPLAESIAVAETKELAVAKAQALLRARLGWASDSESRTAVLSRFALVAEAVFACRSEAGDANRPDIGETLAAFEAWYAETYNVPFWTLFEHHMVETPVVDF